MILLARLWRAKSEHTNPKPENFENASRPRENVPVYAGANFVRCSPDRDQLRIFDELRQTMKKIVSMKKLPVAVNEIGR